jgi:serine/threonine protein kinase
VYQAIDLGVSPPRLCVLKQGRANGEVKWDGRDGHWRVRNEERALAQLRLAGVAVAQVYTSFESEGNYYLVTEFIEGDNLQARLGKRRRRLSVTQVVRYAIQLSLLVSRIHAAGWVWRDCKPANLIITKGGGLRPVDFEGAFPTDRPDTFFWNTPEFAPPESVADSPVQSGVAEDLYALGAVIYYLITGRPPGTVPVPASARRRGVPPPLCAIVSELLSGDPQQRPDGLGVARRLARIPGTPGPGLI